MLSHETAVCKLFGEKRDVSFISKRALINGIANLNADYEILYEELMSENSNCNGCHYFKLTDNKQIIQARCIECKRLKRRVDNYKKKEA